jgi:hypothetical protein
LSPVEISTKYSLQGFSLFSDANINVADVGIIGVDGTDVVGVNGPDENPGFLEVHSTKSQGDEDVDDGVDQPIPMPTPGYRNHAPLPMSLNEISFDFEKTRFNNRRNISMGSTSC